MPPRPLPTPGHVPAAHADLVGLEGDACEQKEGFGVILADPPWEFRVWGSAIGSRSTEVHYPTHGTDWICSLPVEAVAARDCALLLWVTNPHLPDGFRVLEAWGFRYSTAFTWVKMARVGAPRIGLGYRARGCTEQLLLATRGNVPAPPTDRRPESVIFSPRGAHSIKPAYQYDLAELHAGPYLELFHRPRDGMFPPREGWCFLGDAVDGQDMRTALEGLAADRRAAALKVRQGRSRKAA